MAGAAGILFDKLAAEEAVLRLHNRRRVQNHIGGIHAAATALLAESATGAVFAMNVNHSILNFAHPSSTLFFLRSSKLQYQSQFSAETTRISPLPGARRRAAAAQEHARRLPPRRPRRPACRRHVASRASRAGVPRTLPSVLSLLSCSPSLFPPSSFEQAELVSQADDAHKTDARVLASKGASIRGIRVALGVRKLPASRALPAPPRRRRRHGLPPPAPSRLSFFS